MVKPSSATGHQRRSARSSGRKLFKFDRDLGARWVAGADEAGRGCLAGPLVAAAVLFDYDRIGHSELLRLSRLDDSKVHSARMRDHLLPLVLEVASAVAVSSHCSASIDRNGLHVSNLSALGESLARVRRPGCICLVDGFEIEAAFPIRAVVNGDARSAAIAAASVVAKVTRDRFMHRADEMHPGWDFATHVGYSTAEHRTAIAVRGVSPIHRLSFRSIAYRELDLEEAA